MELSGEPAERRVILADLPVCVEREPRDYLDRDHGGKRGRGELDDDVQGHDVLVGVHGKLTRSKSCV